MHNHNQDTYSHAYVSSPMQTLILFYFIIEDHDTLFVMSEGVHFLGIGVLAYKLLKKRNCGGMYTIEINKLYSNIPLRNQYKVKKVNPSSLASPSSLF